MKRSSKVFTMTADTSDGQVCFGILAKKVWVMVVTADGSEAVNSLDNVVKASRIAAKWLPLEMWPQFAVHLHPNNRFEEQSETLF